MSRGQSEAPDGREEQPGAARGALCSRSNSYRCPAPSPFRDRPDDERLLERLLEHRPAVAMTRRPQVRARVRAWVR